LSILDTVNGNEIAGLIFTVISYARVIFDQVDGDLIRLFSNMLSVVNIVPASYPTNLINEVCTPIVTTAPP
jgi:hypothetical protein